MHGRKNEAMTSPQIVFLHALPLDGRMWAAQIERYEGRAIAPTLYLFGSSLRDWSSGVLDAAHDGSLIIIGCSVGGLCALEVARAAPVQVLGVVLIGAKAGVRPEPAFRDEAVRYIRTHGVAAAWDKYWRPIFGRNADDAAVDAARELALAQSADDLVDGIFAFHNRDDFTDFARTWRGTIISINGDQDHTPSAAANADWTSLRNRGAQVVDDCGHYVSLEQPQRFAALLDDAISCIEECALANG